MEDMFNLEGIFGYTIYDDNDNKISEYTGKNKIVNGSFNIIVNLLTNGDPTYKLNVLKLGKGGVVNNVLQTVNVGDTTLYDEIYTAPPPEIIVNSIGDKYIKYLWTLDYSDGNGNNGVNVFNEAGLFTDAGSNELFSRKTFPSIIKDDKKKIVLFWIIKYSFV
ncbi:MAG: hypothetical protein QM489_03975 [Candidatus Izemoplasma sp.]